MSVRKKAPKRKKQAVKRAFPGDRPIKRRSESLAVILYDGIKRGEGNLGRYYRAFLVRIGTSEHYIIERGEAIQAGFLPHLPIVCINFADGDEYFVGDEVVRLDSVSIVHDNYWTLENGSGRAFIFPSGSSIIDYTSGKRKREKKDSTSIVGFTEVDSGDEVTWAISKIVSSSPFSGVIPSARADLLARFVDALWHQHESLSMRLHPKECGELIELSLQLLCGDKIDVSNSLVLQALSTCSPSLRKKVLGCLFEVQEPRISFLENSGFLSVRRMCGMTVHEKDTVLFSVSFDKVGRERFKGVLKRLLEFTSSDLQGLRRDLYVFNERCQNPRSNCWDIRIDKRAFARMSLEKILLHYLTPAKT